MQLIRKQLSMKNTGADLGFSRGGDFQKVLEHFEDLFQVDQVLFPFSEFSYSTKKMMFWPIFLRRRYNFKKQAKKAFFRHFLENFDKKIAFFGARWKKNSSKFHGKSRPPQS